MTKLLALALAAFGCGAGLDSTGDAGADANAVCRPPQGCEARVVSSGCRYICGVGDSGQSRHACVPLADGGVANQGDFTGGVPLELAAEGRVYTADISTDSQNCGDCGIRCAPRERCQRGPLAWICAP